MPATARQDGPARRTATTRRASPSRRASGRRGGQTRQLVVLGALIAVIGGIIFGAWWLGEGRYIETPSLLDMTFEEAQQVAEQDGLRIVRGGTEPSDTFAEGRVMRTDPGPGEKALRGVDVAVVLSSGPDVVAVPDVRDLSQADAEEMLAERDLSADVSREHNADVAEGLVISQSEEPGAEAKRESTIALVISEGPEPITITDFTGSSAQEAEQELTERGFHVTITEHEHSGVQPGFVISQDPRTGEGYVGDQIELEVATQPDNIRMPSVVGMRPDQAEQHLENLGFDEIEIEERGDFDIELVMQQRPQAGREVEPDQEITLIVR